MDALWVAIATAVGSTGIAGVLTRAVQFGRASRLFRSIERLDNALKATPDAASADREALKLARRTDAVSLASLSLVPTAVRLRLAILGVLVSGVFAFALFLVLESSGFGEVLAASAPPKPSPARVIIYLGLLIGLLVLYVASGVVYFDHVINRQRERLIDQVLREEKADWAIVRVFRYPRLTDEAEVAYKRAKSLHKKNQGPKPDLPVL